MIRVLVGNDFLIQEFIDDYIDKKFTGLSEFQLKSSIIRDPKSVSVITDRSPFAPQGRLILWGFKEFSKLEEFTPYVIPKDVDIFIYGEKIDKRLAIVKTLANYRAEFKEFKDLYANQVESWVLQQKSKYKFQINPDAVKMLAVLYGTNLAELKQCIIQLKNLNKLITKDDVLRHGVNVNEFSIFELQDELLLKRPVKSLYVARQLVKFGEQPIGIIRYLINLYYKVLVLKLGDESLIEALKLHPFVLKKLKDSPLTVSKCLKATDLLAYWERQIQSGIDPEYGLFRLIHNLAKI